MARRHDPVFRDTLAPLGAELVRTMAPSLAAGLDLSALELDKRTFFMDTPKRRQPPLRFWGRNRLLPVSGDFPEVSICLSTLASACSTGWPRR